MKVVGVHCTTQVCEYCMSLIQANGVYSFTKSAAIFAKTVIKLNIWKLYLSD